MKRTSPRFLIIGIGVFIFPMVCLSQKSLVDGYIFKNDMRRIEGQIQKQSDIANCRYVNFKDGEYTTKYTPDQVKSWGITGSQHFISEMIKVGEYEEQVFLEYIIKARVSLLVFYGTGDDPRFFVRKEGDEMRELIYTVSINAEDMEVENKQFVGVLNILLSDCPDMSEDISSAHYKLNDLKKLLNNYNTCVAPGELFFEKEVKDQSPVKIGLLIGYNIPGYSIYSTSNSKDMLISAGEDISKGYMSYGLNFSARVSKIEGFSFNLGILYEEFEIEIDMSDVDVWPRQGDKYYSNISISIPIQIRYAYSKYKLRPFAAIGYTSRLFAKHQGNSPGFKTHHKGFNAGLGAEYQVFNFASVYFEFRYQIVKTSMDDPLDFMKLKTNSMVFLTGVNF